MGRILFFPKINSSLVYNDTSNSECILNFYLISVFLLPMLRMPFLSDTGNDTRVSHNYSLSSPTIHIRQSQNNDINTSANNRIAINSLKFLKEFCP